MMAVWYIDGQEKPDKSFSECNEVMSFYGLLLRIMSSNMGESEEGVGVKT